MTTFARGTGEKRCGCCEEAIATKPRRGQAPRYSTESARSLARIFGGSRSNPPSRPARLGGDNRRKVAAAGSVQMGEAWAGECAGCFRLRIATVRCDSRGLRRLPATVAGVSGQLATASRLAARDWGNGVDGGQTGKRGAPGSGMLVGLGKCEWPMEGLREEVKRKATG